MKLRQRKEMKETKVLEVLDGGRFDIKGKARLFLPAVRAQTQRTAHQPALSPRLLMPE